MPGYVIFSSNFTRSLKNEFLLQTLRDLEGAAKMIKDSDLI